MLINYILTRIQSLKNEEGASAIEYALLASLIALAIVLAVTALGVRLDAIFDQITAGI